MNQYLIRRRKLLALVPAVMGGAFLGPLASWLPGVQAKTANQKSTEGALDALLEGNERYLKGQTHKHDFHADRAALAQGQHPIAAVLSCSDSRVVPQFVFDQGPGKLFVMRVAGNIATDEVIASIEYAVNYLKTSLIFVLGHTSCGAINAAIKVVTQNVVLSGLLPELVDPITQAVRVAKSKEGDLVTNTLKVNVRLTADRIVKSKTVTRQEKPSQSIRVVGGLYDLTTGKVSLL
jgi:carbonic anhydrase